MNTKKINNLNRRVYNSIVINVKELERGGYMYMFVCLLVGERGENMFCGGSSEG